jgi:hypothetical protein
VHLLPSSCYKHDSMLCPPISIVYKPMYTSIWSDHHLAFSSININLNLRIFLNTNSHDHCPLKTLLFSFSPPIAQPHFQLPCTTLKLNWNNWKKWPMFSFLARFHQILIWNIILTMETMGQFTMFGRKKNSKFHIFIISFSR